MDKIKICDVFFIDRLMKLKSRESGASSVLLQELHQAICDVFFIDRLMKLKSRESGASSVSLSRRASEDM